MKDSSWSLVFFTVRAWWSTGISFFKVIITSNTLKMHTCMYKPVHICKASELRKHSLRNKIILVDMTLQEYICRNNIISSVRIASSSPDGTLWHAECHTRSHLYLSSEFLPNSGMRSLHIHSYKLVNLILIDLHLRRTSLPFEVRERRDRKTHSLQITLIALNAL